MGGKMARSINRLSARKVSTITESGMHADGGGLNLQVSRSGSKSWIFRFMLNGRAREMGLGPYHTISLLEAREMALECRKQVLTGIDPIEKRKQERLLHTEVNLEAVSFKDCADKYISAKSNEWTNDKHRKQWVSTLETFVYPVFGT
ncbi:MAG: DUF4102 domain-containing protein [Sneathiella sp.]|nr:DUF4102 domain-containing protein [Sneathiella sp.]